MPSLSKATLLVACFLATIPSFAVSAQLAPERIDAIELRADALPGRVSDLSPLIAFAPGETWDEVKIRRTLSNLYATGWVEEAEILARREDGKTTAVVVVRARTWVESVELSGKLGLAREVLLRELEQKPGAPLVEDRVLRSVYALQDLYAHRGYLDAQVRLKVIRHPEPNRVDVVFELASGERARIGEISFVGDLGGVDEAELRRAVKGKEGEGFDPEVVVADTERLRRWLAEHGRLTAEVERPEQVERPEAGVIDLRYPVTIGPTIEVEVIGAEREELRKKGLLPFLDDQVYDEALVVQTCNRLRTFFQQRGHFLVSVTCTEPPSEGERKLVIAIEPGPVLKLDEIRFEGNENVPGERLRELMTTTTRRVLRPGSGRLVAEALEADLANLRSFYLLQGYDQVEVGPGKTEISQEQVILIIPIDEGRRRRVVEIELGALGPLDEATVRRNLPLQPAGPFHPALLEESVQLVRTLLEEEGYSLAAVTPELDWNEEGTLVDVGLGIDLGPQTRVDRVLLRGLRATRADFLRRQVDLQPGEVVSRRRLLEAERELYRLGIFSRVDVELAPATDPGGLRDVVVEVEEGRPWRLTYGLGYHSDDGIEGILGASRANVDGKAGRIQLDLRVSENERRFRLIYDQPTLGKLALPLTTTLFQEAQERESFRVDDRGVQVALTKDFPKLRLGLVYNYRLVQLSEETIDPDQIDREDRDLDISSLTPTFFLDHRNDALDPTRGWSTALQLEFAFPLLSAETELLKFFWQQTQYASLGRLGVLAGSFRVGAIEPLTTEVERDPLVPPELPSSLVPASERFFAGGRTTHRAYDRDQLGIRGQSLIVREDGRILEAGGNGLVLLNLDYRFPIAGPVGGTVFFDLGNVWADWRDIRTQDLKAGFGLGVRYRSPIGPVRLEIGWKLDREPGEDDPVLFLSFGNPF